MSSDPNIVIDVRGLGKCYQIYAEPIDRLKQFVLPRLSRAVGRQPQDYYESFWALTNVDLTVRQGETVGIVGRNGSGKSTLLQLICGTLSPTTGSVETAGRVAALLELGSGFNPEYTGHDNVYMNAALLGLSKAEIDARFDDIVEFSEIGAFIQQPVKTYSSGMLMRLAFSVAVHLEPDVLVIDEALAVGDERFQRKCFGMIESFRNADKTILFVSHSGGTVVELCDRALLLDGGEALAIGEPKEIIAVYQKLIYAAPAASEQIRQEIRNEVAPDPEPGVDESFDPALVSSSRLEYESHGVQILPQGITTAAGEQVNNLIRGRDYIFRYAARFDSSFENVTFGMMIKTISGVEVGGGTSGLEFTGTIVDAGNTLQVDYHFSCNLTPGLYFLNAGVQGRLDGVHTFLHRIVDALCFRVLEPEFSGVTGIADFGCTASITPLEQVDARVEGRA